MKTFEVVFRRSIEIALKKQNYKQWSDVVLEQPFNRKIFFDCILDELKSQLKGTSLNEDQIFTLLNKLNKKNRRYLG